MKRPFSTLAMAVLAVAVGSAAWLLTTASVAQPASAPAGARGERMGAELQKRFAAADVNGDGKLTREEAQARMPRVAAHFDEIDAARSGTITLLDIERWALQKRGARNPR